MRRGEQRSGRPGGAGQGAGALEALAEVLGRVARQAEDDLDGHGGDIGETGELLVEAPVVLLPLDMGQDLVVEGLEADADEGHTDTFEELNVFIADLRGVDLADELFTLGEAGGVGGLAEVAKGVLVQTGIDQEGAVVAVHVYCGEFTSEAIHRSDPLRRFEHAPFAE